MLIFKFKPKKSSLNLVSRLAFIGLNLTKLKFKPRKPKNRHNFLNLNNIVDKLHLIKYKFKIFVAIREALPCARTLFGGCAQSVIQIPSLLINFIRKELTVQRRI